MKFMMVNGQTLCVHTSQKKMCTNMTNLYNYVKKSKLLCKKIDLPMEKESQIEVKKYSRVKPFLSHK